MSGPGQLWHRIWRQGWLHLAAAFLAMGGWAAFANRHEAAGIVAVSALVQGSLSLALTLVMKRLIEALVARLGPMPARILPPLACASLSVALLSTVHLAGRHPRTAGDHRGAGDGVDALRHALQSGAGRRRSRPCRIASTAARSPAAIPAGHNGWPRWLATTSVTPNQISMASMAAAALAGAALWGSGPAQGWVRALLLLTAAVGCQLRLICNLMDGLVAIEAGRKAPDGPFWNEFPDRVADVLILVGLGLGAGQPALGWAAAALAVLTAYTRELGRTCGLAADYSGPMAKPQRMAVVTVAAVLAAAEPLWHQARLLPQAALWLIAAGAAVTALRRAARIVQGLRAG